MDEDLNLTEDISDVEEATPKTDGKRRIFNSQPNLSDGKKSVSLSSVQNPERFPYFKVQEENKQLQNQIYELKAELLDSRTRERFAHEQLNRQIQDIFDDYLRLQRAEDTFKEHEVLSEKYQNAVKEKEKLQKELSEKVKKYEEELLQKKVEIEKLCADLEGDEDFTLASVVSEVDQPGNRAMMFEMNQLKLINDDYLKKIATLENEIAEMKERRNETIRVNSEPSSTFVITEAEQKLAQRLDELLTENKELRQRNESLSQGIVIYMNQVNKYEKEKMSAALSSSQLNLSANFDITDRARVQEMLQKMKKELINSHETNHKLRKKVNNLMGKDTSNITEKSVEEATEAVEMFYGEESGDEEYNMLLKQSEEVCDGLRKRGWLDKTERSNELIDSFANDAPIDVGNKMDEMLERFGKQDPLMVAPEAIDHVLLLNSSIGNILQSSMNATADILNLKENLSGFRNLLVSLFERLKGSAALFDEIRLILTEGEHSPLADKIKEMQLMWISANEKVQNITKAAEAAEKSCLTLEAHISVFEQSIVQTSFVLDHTRRMTLSSMSFLNQIPAESNAVDEAKIKQLTSDLDEANTAYEGALNKIDLLEKQLRSIELGQSEMQMKQEQLMEDKEKMRVQLSIIEEELEVAIKDRDHSKRLLDRSNEKWEETNQKNENLILENGELQKSVQVLVSVRDDLCGKLVSLEFEVNKMQTVIEEKTNEVKEIEEQLEERNENLKDLRKDLSLAHRDIHEKESDFEDLKQEYSAKVRILDEKLTATRQENERLINNINHAAFKEEKDVKTNSTWSPSLSHSPNSSLIFKSTQPQKSIQTDLMGEDISDMESKINELEHNLEAWQAIFNKIEVGLHPLVMNSEKIHQASNLKDGEKNAAKLLRAIEDKIVGDKKTQDVLKTMKDEATSRTSSSSKARSVVYKKSEITNEYKDKLYGDILKLLHKSMDLTHNLKLAAEGKRKNYLFDLEKLIDDSREVRVIADTIRKYISFDKENMPTDVSTLIKYVQSLRYQNKEMFTKLEELKQKYEEMKNQIGISKPDILARIDEELSRIHDVMSNTSIPGVVRSLRNAK